MHTDQDYSEVEAFDCMESFRNFICGVMFTSYLKKTLRETRKNYYFREKKHSSNLINLSELGGELICHVDIDDMCFDFMEKFENAKLYNSIKLLSDKQRDVICKYYIFGNNEVEISRFMGISKQAVNRIRKRALSAMLKNVGEDLS
jgi:RNA polymerase sigma factor (sigma-70 family)